MTTAAQFFPNYLPRERVQEQISTVRKYLKNSPELDSELRLRLFNNNQYLRDFSQCLMTSHDARIETFKDIVEPSGYECLAVNGLNCISDAIEAVAEQAFYDLSTDASNPPFGGIDAYMFCGKYTCTPFGIHTDNEESILIHLGPASKSMWVWEGWQKKQVPEEFASAIHYKLNPGDAIRIPAGIYHVAENRLWSMTMGVAPYHETIESIVGRHVEHDGLLLSSPNCSNISEIDREIRKFTNDIEAMLIHYSRKLISQRHFRFSPDIKRISLKPGQHFMLGRHDIHLYESDNVAYVRGKKLSLSQKNLKLLGKIKDILFAKPKEVISVSELLCDLKADEPALELISVLAGLGVIREHR